MPYKSNRANRSNKAYGANKINKTNKALPTIKKKRDATRLQHPSSNKVMIKKYY